MFLNSPFDVISIFFILLNKWGYTILNSIGGTMNKKAVLFCIFSFLTANMALGSWNFNKIFGMPHRFVGMCKSARTNFRPIPFGKIFVNSWNGVREIARPCCVCNSSRRTVSPFNSDLYKKVHKAMNARFFYKFHRI